MTSREVIVAAMGNANVKAWQQVVRHRESSHADNAYYMISGGGVISTLHEYPWPDESTKKGWKAVGAGQFIPHTWYGLARQYPKDCNNFGRYAQDFGIVALTAGRGALQDVLNGDIITAIRKCREEWTSLPGAAENKKYTIEEALAVYMQFGGGLKSVTDTVYEPVPDTQPAAPIIDHSTTIQPDEEKDMGAGLVMALVQSLISSFAPLAQQKLSDVITKHGGDPTASATITNAVMNAVGSAVGSPVTTDAQALQAVAAVQADPVKLAKVQESALSEIDKLAPVLDKLHEYSKAEWAASEASMDAASERAKNDGTPDQDALITWSLVGFVGLALVALGVGMGALIYYNKPYGEFLALFSGLVGTIIGKYGTRVDYRYGSSRTSAAKDVTIAQMAKNK